MKTITYELTTPLRLPVGETITSLTLREPTAKDIAEHGFPLAPDGTWREEQTNALIAWMAVMPPSFAALMTLRDWTGAALALIGNFLGAPGQTSRAEGSTAIVYSLTTPIELDGEPVKSLNLREPIGKDILRCGYPLKLDGNFREDAATRLLAASAKIPHNAVLTMTMTDWHGAVMAMVTSFLVRQDQKSSIHTSMSDTSSAPTSNG